MDLRPVNQLPPEIERVNVLTHGIGLLLSLIGAVVMVAVVLAHGDLWQIIGCSVFAAALVAVYAASTLSHCFSDPTWRNRFRILDQAFIYLLIVATYTPFALVYLRGGWWWAFHGLLWAIALFGFFSKLLLAHRIESVAVWIYLLLGWLPILTATSLMELVPATALWWMLYGGLCYTCGTAFLLLDHRIPHFHPVWHLFVIAGSAFHFFAILLFLSGM